jgi:catechol 2,3-dioxygenase-like lactoylglutathione lyase family enzyme
VIRFSVGRNRVTVWLDVRDAAPEGSTVKLTFLYQSVDDLDAALAFYRDVLGLAEAWREGDTTVAFELPGSPVQLIVDVRPDDHPKWGSGMFLQVDDVDAFVGQHPSLKWLDDPIDVPDGRAATFSDPAGNTIHIFDERSEGS